MDKTLAGLLGAVGALAAISPTHAATAVHPSLDETMQAASYADLLKPIPNATALLKASDAQLAEAPQAEVMAVQYHHHHHHHRYYRRRYYHHHHHHHHHHSYRPAIVIPLPR